jgi:hypothetical protein
LSLPHALSPLSVIQSPGSLNYSHSLFDIKFQATIMPSTRQAVWAPNAPKPNGDYSHAIKSKSGMIYLAGWMGDDPQSGDIVPGGIEAQTVRKTLPPPAPREPDGHLF